MNRLINYIRDKHTLWYKFLLYIFSVATIVLFMPGEGSFKYETNRLEGNPWQFENLTAPFDFPVYKSDNETAMEREEIINNKKHYFFRSNSTINEKASNEFIERLRKSGYAEICKKIIDTVYKSGIIETSEITQNKKLDFPVFLVEKNEEKEFKLGDFFTLNSTNEFIKDSLSAFPLNDRIRLQDSILNYFSVSVFYNKELSEKALNQALTNILPS
ncbi:MAG: hypothetical protein ACK452_17325, partial [Bacteroidota bacterium]